MVYSHAWPLFKRGCQRINWNWTQIKLNSSLSGMNYSGADNSLRFRLSFSVSNLTQQNSVGILEYYMTNFSFISSKGISLCQSLRSRATQAQELFTLSSLWNNLPLSVCSAISVATFKKKSGHISLACPFSHGHQHAQRPIDVAELLHRFCCWTLIQLSRHWAWLL